MFHKMMMTAIFPSKSLLEKSRMRKSADQMTFLVANCIEGEGMPLTLMNFILSYFETEIFILL